MLFAQRVCLNTYQHERSFAFVRFWPLPVPVSFRARSYDLLPLESAFGTTRSTRRGFRISADKDKDHDLNAVDLPQAHERPPVLVGGCAQPERMIRPSKRPLCPRFYATRPSSFPRQRTCIPLHIPSCCSLHFLQAQTHSYAHSQPHSLQVSEKRLLRALNPPSHPPRTGHRRTTHPFILMGLLSSRGGSPVKTPASIESIHNAHALTNLNGIQSIAMNSALRRMVRPSASAAHAARCCDSGAVALREAPARWCAGSRACACLMPAGRLSAWMAYLPVRVCAYVRGAAAQCRQRGFCLRVCVWIRGRDSRWVGWISEIGLLCGADGRSCRPVEQTDDENRQSCRPLSSRLTSRSASYIACITSELGSEHICKQCKRCDDHLVRGLNNNTRFCRYIFVRYIKSQTRHLHRYNAES